MILKIIHENAISLFHNSRIKTIRSNTRRSKNIIIVMVIVAIATDISIISIIKNTVDIGNINILNTTKPYVETATCRYNFFILMHKVLFKSLLKLCLCVYKVGFLRKLIFMHV